MRLKNALYGALQTNLLLWKYLSGTLKDWGFELIPYDECVSNQYINVSQCTILWHVDDLNISHVEPKVIDNIINTLNKKRFKGGITHCYLKKIT